VTTQQPRYSPLDLLKGQWLRIIERPGLTLVRRAPTHPRLRIASVAGLLVAYWTVGDRLPPQVAQFEFFFVVIAIWLLIAKWNRGEVVLAVIEKAEAAAAQFPNVPPRQIVAVNQIAAVEVRDNLWQGRGITPLSQIYLHRKDSPAAVLLYQDRRQHRWRVAQLAKRLAERWEARLLTNEIE
jgi:hypothetical protein